MPYDKFHEEWEERPTLTTPVTAEALEHIEQGIADAADTADTAASAASDAAGGLTAHLDDTSNAHAATAVSVSPIDGTDGTNVQTVLEAIQGNVNTAGYYPGGPAVPLEDGGTGATTAPGARVNLGAAGLTGDETLEGVKTFAEDPVIPADAYDATDWDDSMSPPTKGAVRDVIEGLSGTYAPLSGRLTDLAPATADPLIVAHRGGANLHPEHTVEAYRGIVAQGAKAIELDCYLLLDGSLGVMHDSTLTRTTTSTGDTEDLTAANWQALTVDIGATLGGAYTSLTQKAPLLGDVVREFANKVFLVIEGKNTGSCDAIVAVLQKYNVHPDAAMVCSTTYTELALAVTAGYHTQAIGDALTPATIAGAGIGWVACSTATSDAYIDSMTAVGVEVMVHTVNRQWQRDLFTGYGAIGFYSDDPIYVANDHNVLTTDPFTTGAWYHGQVAGGTAGTRGTLASSKMVWTQTSFISVVQGWASPLADPDNLVLTFSVDFVTGAAATNWVCVDLCSNDASPPSNAVFGTSQTGYRCLLRKNGNVAVYRVTSAGATLLEIAAGTVTTISDGSTATYKITVTPTTVKAERTDVANATTAIADATYRSLDYLIFGGDNIAARWHAVTVA